MKRWTLAVEMVETDTGSSLKLEVRDEGVNRTISMFAFGEAPAVDDDSPKGIAWTPGDENPMGEVVKQIGAMVMPKDRDAHQLKDLLHIAVHNLYDAVLAALP